MITSRSTWMGRYPVDVTTLLVVVHVVLHDPRLFSDRFGGGAFLNSASLRQRAGAWHGHSGSSSPTLLSIRHRAFFGSRSRCTCSFVFGREVERFLGRRAFICALRLLLCVADRFFSHLGTLARTGFAGSATFHFGIFVAFAAIYPNVECFLRIRRNGSRLILAAAYSLQLLAYHDWASSLCSGSVSATAFLFHSAARSRARAGLVRQFEIAVRPKPKFHVVRENRPPRG